MTDTITTPPGGRLTMLQGTAMYVGAVLGTGVIALPALAAETAGPASLLAWAGLVVVSAPLAAVFAALGARHPDAGGVSTYARLAFGERAAAMVGWWFFFCIPSGMTAAGLFAGDYVAAAVGGGDATAALTAVALFAASTAANAGGVRVSGRLQLGLAGLLVTLLLVSVLLSLPEARLDNFQPFAPNGWLAIGPAAALLVWSFAGWEAITHLAAEFRRPDRDLPRATAAAVVLVGLLYLSVACAVIAVLGAAAARSEAPLGELMAVGLGGNARVLAAVAAVLLTLGVMNVYMAGGSKLGAALGRDGAFPGMFARGSVVGDVPRRSLALLSALSFLALFTVVLTGVGPRPMVLLTTGSFMAVYAMGVAAALRLLPRGGKAHAAALVALVAVALLLVMFGVYLLWPLFVTGAAMLYLRRRQRKQRSSGRRPRARHGGTRAAEIPEDRPARLE